MDSASPFKTQGAIRGFKYLLSIKAIRPCAALLTLEESSECQKLYINALQLYPFFVR